jgi:hypothetical protein
MDISRSTKKSSTKASNSDELTLKLLEEINNRKAEIKSLERTSYVTNMSLTIGTVNYNINVITDIRVIIDCIAYIESLEERYNKVVSDYSIVGAPVFKYCGYTSKDWVTDLMTKLGKIQISEKRKYLETLEARLNAIVSPELRAQMELENIARELTG